MKVALVLLVPFLVFTAWQYATRKENENRLALVASAVADREVDVSCPGFWTRLVEITPNAGWVDFDEHGVPDDRTRLSAATCSSLEGVWKGDAPAGHDAMWALVTLAHESWHLRGVKNEAQTQCYAIQSVYAVARGLGVPERGARLVAARAALDDALKPPGDYKSRECRPGGAFDLNPHTPDWPTG